MLFSAGEGFKVISIKPDATKWKRSACLYVCVRVPALAGLQVCKWAHSQWWHLCRCEREGSTTEGCWSLISPLPSARWVATGLGMSRGKKTMLGDWCNRNKICCNTNSGQHFLLFHYCTWVHFWRICACWVFFILGNIYFYSIPKENIAFFVPLHTM